MTIGCGNEFIRLQLLNRIAKKYKYIYLINYSINNLSTVVSSTSYLGVEPYIGFMLDLGGVWVTLSRPSEVP